MGFKLSKSFGWSLARDFNPGAGVPAGAVALRGTSSVGNPLNLYLTKSTGSPTRALGRIS